MLAAQYVAGRGLEAHLEAAAELLGDATTVRVLFGARARRFVPGPTFDVAARVEQLHAGDFDGEGSRSSKRMRRPP